MKQLVVFDLDGTLALNDHRQHFVQRPVGKKDWDSFFEACDQDVPNQPVIGMLVAIYDADLRVEIWSGRTDAVHGKTRQWLNDYGMAHIPLRMRKANDRRADTVVKKEWLDAEPHPPIIVFDDRDSVVAMWRENGIVCAQVAEGNF